MISPMLFKPTAAFAISFLIMMLIGKHAINLLRRLQLGQFIREVGPQSHLKKAGTPTLGGVLIVLAILIPAFLLCDLHSLSVWTALISLTGFAAIGFADDFLKVILKNNRGLRSRWKYFWQSVLGLVAALLLFKPTAVLNVPLFIHVYSIPLGGVAILLYYFVVVGASNAVNLTDGLDGLVSVPVLLVALGMGFLAWQNSSPEAAQMLILCAALMGATLGFLWFNAHPAQVFMGDVGALSLGALLGVIAIVIQQEILLAVMGGIFVAETVSVMLQVASFRLRKGKRIFKMAPLHHHFELSGWPETKVVVRFWIISVILLLLGLAL